MQEINPGLQENARSHFLNYLQLLWYRRRFILLVTALVFLAGLVLLNERPAVYESTASLRVGVSSAAEASSSGIDEIRGEMEVLRSRELASAVIQKLQLQIYGEFNPEHDIAGGPLTGMARMVEGWLTGRETVAPEQAISEKELSPDLPQAIDIYVSKLSITRAGESDVVNVTFRSRDSELAARIANTAVEVYLDRRMRQRIEASEYASEFAGEQYLKLKGRMAEAARAVDFYRSTFEPGETESIAALEEEVAELNSRLVIAQSEKSTALARLELIESLSGDDAQLESVADDLGSAVLSSLLDRREDGAEEVLDEVNAGIRAELDRMIIDLQQAAAAASAQTIAIESRLTDLALESSTQHRRLLQLGELEREAELARVRFEAAGDRLRERSRNVGLLDADSEIISTAAVSKAALHPGRAGHIAWILAFGFGLSLLLLLIQQKRNPGLLSPEHVYFVLGENTVGVVPASSEDAAPHDLVVKRPDSNFAQAVGALKVTLDLTDLDSPVKVVQLVSAMPGEGRASLALALARSETMAGRKVLLVSAHLRRSTIDRKLDLPEHTQGLTDLMLAEDRTVADFVVSDPLSDLDFLSAGTAEYANPGVIFSSQRMRSIVESMRGTYDFIVFDTPPTLNKADAIAIGKLVDATLLVVRWNKTPKRVVAGSLEQLREGGIDIAGVVLQHVNLRRYGSIGFSDFGYLYHQKR